MSFHFLNGVFRCTKALNSMMSNMSIFSSVTCVFGVTFKTIAKPRSWSFAVMHSHSVIVLALLFSPLIHTELIFIYSVKQGSSFSFSLPSSLSFCIRISGFFCTKCWRNYSFSIKYSWHSCQNSINCRYMSLFLNSQFYSIDLYVCLYASTTLF